MKKWILASVSLILAIAVTMIACDLNGIAPNGVTGNEFAQEKFDKSGNLKEVTLNLGGGEPSNNAGRALTNTLAQINHDYYEVVFYYNAAPSVTVSSAAQIARVAWSRGEGAALAVFRGNNGAVGIDYGSVDYSLSEVSGDPANDPDTGAAILFVGKKESGRYVLLAVGKLNGTTNNDGTAGDPTVVTSKTSKVKFDIVTLASAVKPTIPITAATSSFFTIPTASASYDFENDAGDIDATSTASNPGGGTNFIAQPYNAVNFPLFMLASDQAAVPVDRHYAAKFTFTTATGTGAATGTHTIGNYVNGIVAAVPAGHKYTDIIPPGFIVGGDKSKPNTDIEGVKVEMKNNSTTAEQLKAINNEAYFIITVPGNIGGMIAFTFNIPVYAISNRISNNSVNAIQWLIQPGLETLFVDNGVGLGGSVLFGIGDPSKIEIGTAFLP